MFQNVQMERQVDSQESFETYCPKNIIVSVVTGILTAAFDPLNAVVPFPSNLFFTGTTDLTVNIPFSPSDSSAPKSTSVL